MIVSSVPWFAWTRLRMHAKYLHRVSRVVVVAARFEPHTVRSFVCSLESPPVFPSIALLSRGVIMDAHSRSCVYASLHAFLYLSCFWVPAGIIPPVLSGG